MRKAIMQVSKEYKFGLFLNKGEEVFIREEETTGGTVYTAMRKEGDTITLGVHKNEFKYQPPTTYKIGDVFVRSIPHTVHVDHYIISQIIFPGTIRSSTVQLTNTESGYAWDAGIKVKDLNNITADEFRLLTGAKDGEFVKI